MSENMMEQAEQGMERYFFRASAEDFKKIPGEPIAYWATDSILKIFSANKFVSDVAEVKIGMGTGKNSVFVRDWWEVNYRNIDFSLKNINDLIDCNSKYYPYNKGGDYRLWYGNQQQVLWFDSAGRDFMNEMSGHRENGGWNYYFQSGITWSFISSSKFGVRFIPEGFAFDVSGSTLFTEEDNVEILLGFLSSTTCFYILSMLNPTLNYQAGNIKSLPLQIKESRRYDISSIVRRNISIAREDWDSSEPSWNFQSEPILSNTLDGGSMESAYRILRQGWSNSAVEMRRLEEKNNRIFIEAYGLQDELTPEVPLEEITLTCNPHYRYGGNRTDEEREALLLQDTMAEFCSYAVGCMFGRYSLDKPGLVLANQGDTLQDYLHQVPQPSFMPDDDNVIPLLDADWFADDVTGRFLDFLRVIFGTEHYAENLAFVERGLNVTNKRNYSIRDFFVKEFYDYHVRMYKKRPIYWLFASPRGTFQALVYLHRYRPDTVSVVLRYLREFRGKLAARRQLVELRLTDVSASQGEKTRLTKELEQLRKQILELDDYEHDVLFPLAGQRLEIDLDDGVKANYPKFGKALKKVAGL